MTSPYVRLAELSIAPEQLDAFRDLLAEEIASSVALEPGVLALHAVSLEAEPHQVRLLEVYADRQAYEAHLNTPHFLHYKRATSGMVVSLRLIDANPLALAAKRDFPARFA